MGVVGHRRDRVSVTGRRRDLSWCRGRDVSTAGGGEGGNYQCACRGPPAGPVWVS